MKYLNFWFFCSVLSFSSLFGQSEIGNTDSCCCAQDNNTDLWTYPEYFYVGHTEGKGLGYHHGYSTIGLFLAPSFLATNSIQPFVDGKGCVFNNGKWAASAGSGLRYIYSENLVLGLNAYYDYRRFHHYDLNQVGIGFEVLGPYFDFRINGYIPVCDQKHHEITVYDFGDCYEAVRSKKISSWEGFDAEIGTWLWKKSPCDFFGLYVAAGPYYYGKDDKHSFCKDKDLHACGGRARILARFCNFLDLSVIATYDPIWQTCVQGQINIAIPLDGQFFRNLFNGWCCQHSCMCLTNQIAIQPVQRYGIIVADKDCSWKWNW